MPRPSAADPLCWMVLLTGLGAVLLPLSRDTSLAERVVSGPGAPPFAAARWLADGGLPPEPLQALHAPLLTLLGLPVSEPAAFALLVPVAGLLLAALGLAAVARPGPGRLRTLASPLLGVGALLAASGALLDASPIPVALGLTLAAVGVGRTGRPVLACAVGLAGGLAALPAWPGLLLGRWLPRSRLAAGGVGALVAVSVLVRADWPVEGLVLTASLLLAGLQLRRASSAEADLLGAAATSALAVLFLGEGVALSVGLLLAAPTTQAVPRSRTILGAGALALATGVALMTVRAPLDPDPWQSEGALAALDAQLPPGESAAVVRFSEDALQRGSVELQWRRAGLEARVLLLAQTPTDALAPLSGHPAPTWAWVGWEDSQAAPALAWIQDHADLEGAVTWTAANGRGGVILPLGAHSHSHPH